VRYPPIFDFLEVPPQPAENLLPLCIAEFLLEFFQSEVDDIVVMKLFRGDIATEFKPNTVQHRNLLRREVRRMGTQIKDVFLSAGEIDLKGQLWFWVG
jgi:hypothetical protein